MDESILEKMKEDKKRCQSMTDIDNAELVLGLITRLIDYQSITIRAITDEEHKIGELKGQLKILQEYMRIAKDRYKELSILEGEMRRTKNYESN